jgi:sugar O-acyltransferase (sialic acid O-acetyltransferase NeuD family)
MNSGNEVLLHGGGGHAKVVIDSVRASSRIPRLIFDPKYKQGTLLGVPYGGEYHEDIFPETPVIISIGNNSTRQSVVKATRHRFTSTVHPSALISPYSSYDEGCMIFHGTIIQASTRIGKHVIINTGSRVDHDCVISDFAHIGPGAGLCGNVYVGEGTLVGAGAVVLPGVRIGAWCTVGAGAVVIKDVADGTTVVGNPAKVLSNVV